MITSAEFRHKMLCLFFEDPEAPTHHVSWGAVEHFEANDYSERNGEEGEDCSTRLKIISCGVIIILIVAVALFWCKLIQSYLDMK